MIKLRVAAGRGGIRKGAVAMKKILSGAGIAGMCIAAGLAMGPTGADAAEYFIPKGHLYAPGTGDLPPAQSRRAQVEAQTDVLETELHRRKREDRLFYDRFRDFIDRDVATPGYDGGGHYSYY
jgi:hypothetical protein